MSRACVLCDLPYACLPVWPCTRATCHAAAGRGAADAAAAAAAGSTGADVEWRVLRRQPRVAALLAARRRSIASNASPLEDRVALQHRQLRPAPRGAQRDHAADDRRRALHARPASRATSSRSIRRPARRLWVWRPNDGEQRFARGAAQDVGPRPRVLDRRRRQRAPVRRHAGVLSRLRSIPSTGRPVPGFGENGVVDLMVGVRGEVNDKSSIGNSSPALVVGDVVVVGPAHEVGMRPPSKAQPQRRRARLRRAHRQAALDVPHDPGARRARLRDLARTARPSTRGNAGVWAPMTADAELGFVYLPVEAPIARHLGRRAATATISTATASCASTRRRASGSGTTS